MDLHNKASYYPKTTDRSTVLTNIAVVDGKLVLQVEADPALERYAGTLVCEPWTDADTARIRAAYPHDEGHGDPVLGLTVTRFGQLFHDEGEFTLLRHVRLDQLTVTELSAELCRRMAAGKPLGDYHEQTDPDKQGIPGELDTVSEAKDICRDILKAAKRNGLGGCALCAG
jgi:glutamine synthetase